MSFAFLKTLMWCACVAGALFTATAWAAADARIQQFDIPGQELSTALEQFAVQSDLEILFAPEDAAAKRTEGVRGEYVPTEALRILLSGTGLQYRVTRADSIIVEGAGSRATSSALPATRGESTLLAQASNAQATSDSRVPSEREAQRRTDAAGAELGEVVVTGSRIRGGGGASSGSKVIVIGREEIDRSGLPTAQQIIQSLPQNFGGGASEDTTVEQGSAAFNITSAVGVNLRGLGPASTLLLVNGRRVPAATTNTNVYDISMIPASAIERIEVLTDGASAIYGSDAIAGVVNVVLREDYEGAETRARFGGVTTGQSKERQFAQTFGGGWNRGNGLISYEYYDRSAILNDDRRYTASSDLRPLGGDDFSGPNSNPGTLTPPISGFGLPEFAIPAGQDGTALTEADLVPGANLNNDKRRGTLLPDQKRQSVTGMIRQEIGGAVELFIDGRYSVRDTVTRAGGGIPVTLSVPPANPFYVNPYAALLPPPLAPFFPNVNVAYNLEDDLAGRPRPTDSEVKSLSTAAGADIQFTGNWRLQVYGGYGEERSASSAVVPNFAAINPALADPDPATAFNPFGDGANSGTDPAVLDTFLTTQDYRLNSEVRSANATLEGRLFHLPGGDVRLAIGSDYREEEFFRRTPSGSTSQDMNLEREVLAGFGELLVPLFGPENARAGFRSLTISAAARVDDYKKDTKDLNGVHTERDTGSTTNPKFGLSWQILDGFRLRGTWGTSFRAPNLPTLGGATVAFVQPVPDPTSPTGDANALLLVGTDPDLKNETATTISAGFAIAPVSVPGLQFGATYVRTEFKDRIAALNTLEVLNDEEQFAGLFERNPDPAEVAAICNDPAVFPFQPPAICDTVSVIVDLRVRNAAVTKVDSIDFDVSYAFDTQRLGRFDLRTNTQYMLNFDQAFSAEARETDVVDTVHNPLSLRMRNSVTWSGTQGLSATLYVNYADSYADDLSDPPRKIDSWITADLTLSYDTLGRLAGLGLDNTTFTLSALNVLDEDPPFVNNASGVGYDPENADGLNRFIAFNVIKRW